MWLWCIRCWCFGGRTALLRDRVVLTATRTLCGLPGENCEIDGGADFGCQLTDQGGAFLRAESGQRDRTDTVVVS